MSGKLIQGLYHFTVYAIGVLVLAAAILVTSIRLVLPDIGSYRSEVEAWVSSYSDFPLVFHSIEANWRGWIPELTLKDIDLLNKAGTEPIIHFDNAVIQIAPLSTIIERRFIPRSLVISGFELSVAYLSNGAIYIGGIKLEGVNTAETGKNELAEWFFKQDEIGIRNAKIEWKDIKNRQTPILLSDVSLTLRNDIGRFQVDGSAILPADYGNKLDFAFDAYGDLMSSEWSGELYLSGSEINPDNWYSKFRPLDFNITGGNADIQVWSSWNKARLTSLEGLLQYNNFAAQAGTTSLHVDELAYQFRGQRNMDNGWDFRVILDRMATENGLWPGAEFMISSRLTENQESFRYDTNFSYLRLDDLSLLFSNAPFLPEQAKNFLATTSIAGELRDGKISYDPSLDPAGQISFATTFAGLTAGLNDDIPSFINLSGSVSGSLKAGTVSLDTDTSEMMIPAIAEDPIKLRELSGKISWLQDENADWHFNSDLLRISTEDFSFSIAGTVARNHDYESPFIDLVLDMNSAELESMIRYVPATETFRLRSWLERSMSGGTIDYANAVFRGALLDFPFDSNNGNFKIIAGITGTTLDFSPSWPPVDEMDGELVFTGKSMTAKVNNGKIFDADITGANAYIPDILSSEKNIAIDGHVKGDTRALTLFVEQSPLNNDPSLHELAKTIRSGDFGLDLDLAIPLRQPGKRADVAGAMNIREVQIVSPKINNLSLENLTGHLSFTDNSVTTDSLTGTYMGRKISVDVSGTKNDRDNPYSITLSGTADSTFITDRIMDFVPVAKPLQQDLLDRIQGQTDWQARIIYDGDNSESGLNRHIEITSQLNGLSIDLPEPAGKAANSNIPFRITTEISDNPEKTVNVYLDSILLCEFKLDKNQAQVLQKVTLKFGDITDSISGNRDIQISGSLDLFSLYDWMQVFSLLSSRYIARGTSPLLNDIAIDLQLTSLEMFNNIFSNVRVNAVKTQETWKFDLEGSEIKGTIRLPARMDRSSLLRMDLERLHISDKSPEGEETRSSPLKMPALDISIQDLVYHGRAMGAFRLNTTPVAAGINIDQFEFRKTSLDINGHGKWIIENDAEFSSFDITLNAAQWDAMTNTFGYDGSLIQDGETTIRINADWSGSPMDFALKNLNGRLEMDIFKGEFLHANPAAGRLFGLLSIQALPRRLLLDFRDLFSKGLSFDKIAGSFEIDKGNAYTNNLYMRGPAADVAVTGRTGLADKDYDQIVTVTPQISNSLPLAGAVFGPVGIGVGAVIYLAGELFNSLHNNIDKILSAQYTITGSWNDPVIEKRKNNEYPVDG
jgi:uncharacterized protein (TIGR02099 family)